MLPARTTQSQGWPVTDEMRSKCAAHVRGGRVDRVERIERTHESIAFLAVATRVADLHIADPGASEPAPGRQRLQTARTVG